MSLNVWVNMGLFNLNWNWRIWQWPIWVQRPRSQSLGDFTQLHSMEKEKISNVTKLIQFLIFKGFINENIRGLKERMVMTYLACGNVTNLVDNRCQVFYSMWVALSPYCVCKICVIMSPAIKNVNFKKRKEKAVHDQCIQHLVRQSRVFTGFSSEVSHIQKYLMSTEITSIDVLEIFWSHYKCLTCFLSE